MERTHLVRQWLDLFGCLPPDQAAAQAELLTHGPELAAALLRQSLVLDPYQPALFGRLLRRSPAPNPVPFMAWLRALGSSVNRAPGRPSASGPEPGEAEADPAALLAAVRAEPSPGRRLPLVLRLWRLGAAEALVQAVAAHCATATGRLAGPLLAWGLRAAGRPEAARKLADRCPATFLTHNLRARLALDAGDGAAALGHWMASLAFEPEQAWVRALAARGSDRLPPPGAAARRPVRLCLADPADPALLEATLAHLAAATPPSATAGVTVLLHHGPDDQAARLTAAAGPLPLELVRAPDLPGAGAARNRLLALDSVRRAGRMALLAPGARPVPGWLDAAAQDLDEDPALVVVGGKVVSDGGVRLVRQVYRQLAEMGPDHVRLTPAAPRRLDLGQFDGARPCLTAPGACRVLDLERLERLSGVAAGWDGGFLTPTAADQAHDFAVWRAGGRVLYDGRLETALPDQLPDAVAALHDQQVLAARWSSAGLAGLVRDVTEAGLPPYPDAPLESD
ncbi:MAG: hypothetical protein AB7D57_05035 [Desulfovibrionaceae bacterium]